MTIYKLELKDKNYLSNQIEKILKKLHPYFYSFFIGRTKEHYNTYRYKNIPIVLLDEIIDEIEGHEGINLIILNN